MEYITLALAAIAVILGIVILSKVNKLITMLHTPIVKRVSDTNLKPNRHPVSAQDMAARNNDRRENNRNNDRRERGNSGNANRQERSFNRDRNDRRNDRRNGRNEVRSGRRDFAQPETTPVAAPVDNVPSAPVDPVPAPAVEETPRVEGGRRALPPRIHVTLPEAPVAAPAAPAAAEVETTLGAEFDPAKVRYGRRNVVKKIPVEDSPESTEEAQA